jgi:outer membrane lipoprotein-sorting protein
VLLVLGLLAATLVTLAPAASSQSPEVLLPEQSAVKAKELLQQTIAAMGGSAYLSVRDADCTARLSLFGHSGDLTGYDLIHDIWKFPDKNRTEYGKKENQIEVFNGHQGWVLDKGGVTDAPEAAVDDFQELLKKDIDNVLRYRLKEEGMTLRYGGADIVDLKQVDWVELVDRDRRTFRLALDRSTHLPIRFLVITRNPTTRERTEEASYFSNYHPLDGVQTPFQVTRERNGLKVYQVFYSGCRYNTNLSEDLFTRAALEHRWSEIGKKGKKK